MQRVKRATAAVAMPAAPAGGAPGFFAAPNPGGGVPATVPGYEWYNGVQEELMAVIEGAGLTGSDADHTKLRQAIAKMIQGGQRSVIINNAVFAGAVTGTGKAVYWDSANSRFDLALADGSAKQNCVGVADVANTSVYAFGDAILFSGLTPGARYYLDGTTAGAITTTAPANGVYLGIARTATEVFVDIDGLGVQANQSNNFTKGQSGTVLGLPATTGTLAFDLTGASNFSGQVTGDCTFGNGYTGPGAGKATWFSIRIQQNAATLRNWSFGTSWKHVGGASAIPAQTQTLGAWDEIIGQVLTDGTISFAVRSNVS